MQFQICIKYKEKWGNRNISIFHEKYGLTVKPFEQNPNSKCKNQKKLVSEENLMYVRDV